MYKTYYYFCANTLARIMCSDTDEEGPPPAAPVAELLPAALQEVLQGTSLDEMVDVFTMEAWGKLDEMQRMHLGALLPPGNRDEAVRALFGRDQLQLCPPPLDRFWRQMSAGDFSFEGQRRAQELELSRRRELVAQMREHHNNTVHKLHYLRRTWSCPPPQPPQPKNSGHSGEVLVYNKQGGGLVRRSRTAAPGQAPPQLGRPYGSSVGAGTIAGGAPRPKATTRVLATPSGHALGGGKCNSPAQLAAPVQPAGPVHSAAGPGPPGGAPLVGAGGHMAAAGGEDEGAGGGWNCPSHLQARSGAWGHRSSPGHHSYPRSVEPRPIPRGAV